MPVSALDLLLEIIGKFFVALRGNNRERVDLKAVQALALLIDAQAQAAPNGLPSLAFGADVAQGANLKDVGIVPTFAQSRVREDELEKPSENSLFHLIRLSSTWIMAI